MNKIDPIVAAGGGIDRRSLLMVGLGVAAGVPLSIGSPAHAAGAIVDPMAPVPLPPQVLVKQGLAQIGGKRLFYWDTGGSGTPIVLMHPASGSAFVWGYQQPVFAQADHRVIAYSRANYRNSDAVPAANPGIASSDLDELVDFLGVGKFYAVATAAGSSVTLDFALSRPARLLGMVLSSGTYGGVQEPEYVEHAQALAIKGLAEMPAFFRELGPSYRAANLDGTRAWMELQENSKTGTGPNQKAAVQVTWAHLAALQVPVLFIAGDSDLDAPPGLMRRVADHVPGSEFLAVAESGHSIYWEHPQVFNRAVLDFIARHRA